MKKLFYGVAMLLLCGSMASAQQAGKSPYPIIFVHGYDGNSETFSATIQELEAVFGDYDANIDVFHAVLNADPNSTHHNDDVRTDLQEPDGTSVNAFLSRDGSLFAMSFKNSLDENGRILIGDPGGSFGTTSAGDRNAIVKQGKALGLMIAKVLERTRANKVILVGHSMGGLAIREYLQRYDGATHPWWVDQENAGWNASGHKVARVVTIGTPHVGTNIWAANDPPPREEAIRDLRWKYTDIPETPGLYLFGGFESAPNASVMLRNRDVDCDGDETSMVEGINALNTFTYSNNMPLPPDIGYSWITSDDGIFPGGDGIVDLKRQWLHDASGNALPSTADSLLTDVLHFNEGSDYVSLTRGLDEPDVQSLAYELGFGTSYAGLVTHQSNMTTQDEDYYFFEVQNVIDIKFTLAVGYSGVHSVTITGPGINESRTNLAPLQGQIINLNDVPPGTYYVQVIGDADQATFLDEYTMKLDRLISGVIVRIPEHAGGDEEQAKVYKLSSNDEWQHFQMGWEHFTSGTWESPFVKTYSDVDIVLISQDEFEQYSVGTPIIGPGYVGTPTGLDVSQNQAVYMATWDQVAGPVDGYNVHINNDLANAEFTTATSHQLSAGASTVRVAAVLGASTSFPSEEVDVEGEGSGGNPSNPLDQMKITPDILDYGLTATELGIYISKETSPGSITWSATPSQSWITVSPASGNGNDSLYISIDRSQLTAETYYTESVSISSTAGTQSLPLTVDTGAPWQGEITYTFDSATPDWTITDRDSSLSGISDGVMTLAHASTGNFSDAVLTAAGSIFSEVTMTFTMDNGVSETDNEHTEVYVNWQDPDHYYRWYIVDDMSDARVVFQRIYLDNNQVQQSETIHTVYAHLPAGAYTVTAANGVHTFKDDSTNGSIINVSANSGVYTYGRVGFGVNEEVTSFDNITVDGASYVPVTPNTAFILDSYTIGLYHTTGLVASPEKCTNEATGQLLQEVGVGSTTGINFTQDGAYIAARGVGRLVSDVATSLNGLTQATFEGWFQVDNTQNNVLFGRWGSNASQFIVEWQSDNTIYIYLATSPGDPGTKWATANIPRELNTWYYVAVVYDGAGATNSDKLKLYVDAVEYPLSYTGTPPANLTSVGSSPLVLGNYEDATRGSSLGGCIGPQRISNIARSAQEIQASFTGTTLLSVSDAALAFTVESLVDTVQVSTGSATSITKTQSWLSISPASISSGLNQDVVVTVDTTGLAAATHTDTLVIADSDTSISIPVALSLTGSGGDFAQDSYTIGLFHLDGAMSAGAKLQNAITGADATHTSVSSSVDHKGTLDGAGLFDKATHSRIITDVATGLNGIAEFTFEGIISFDNPNNNVVFGRDNGSAIQLEWQSSSGKLYAFAGSGYGYTTTITRTTNEWYYIAMVYNGNLSNSNRIKIYINGTEYGITPVGTIPGTLPNAGTTPLILGYYKDQSAGTSNLGGAISAARISNTARSAAEIQDTYTNTVLAKRAYAPEQETVFGLIPDQFALHQNYPNPFNPTTTIRFDIPEQRKVTLQIFSITGRLIETLVDDTKAPGSYQVTWKGTKAPSGIYLYRIQAGSFVETKKLTLIK